MQCAYCEQPLICESCQAPYQAASPEQYEALTAREEEVTCPACGEVLVCHWCKAPYDGLTQDEADLSGGAAGS